MCALFADYQPRAVSRDVAVDMEPMTKAHVDECVALAVQREGGDEVAWRASFERSLDVADRTTFVALLDGRVAGYGAAGWFEPSSTGPGSTVPDGWYLLGLVVDPQYRRRGIGRALTVSRLAWLKDRARRAWFFVSSANRASIDLHTALGFHLAASSVEVPGVMFTDSGQLYAADLG